MKAQRRTTALSFLFVGFIAVIALFLLTPKLWTPTRHQRDSQAARVRMNELEAALRLFSFDTGRFPTTREGLEALVGAPGDLKSWNGPYLTRLDILNDPWNRPFIYRCPGQHGAFDIFTFGRDGIEGGEGEDADITTGQR